MQDHKHVSINVTVRDPVPPVFQEDITPPIPDIKNGAFLFTIDLLQWAVHIALKLAGYAVMIWLAWTVLTAGD
ncbi:MAG: hypothetical protein IJS39_05930 [Synergistaceae bacterium]|nr:hypothetical protein [Synergistaceae bacterium]